MKKLLEIIDHWKARAEKAEADTARLDWLEKEALQQDWGPWSMNRASIDAAIKESKMNIQPTENHQKLAYEILFATEDGPATVTEAAQLIAYWEARAVEKAETELVRLRAENEDLAIRGGLRLSALDYEKLNTEAFKARVEKAEDELKQTQSSALNWARFAGDKAACADIAEQRAQITERLWKEFITLMDITEESDSGNAFNPNKISSCRAMDGKRLNEILNEARQIVF